MLEFTDERLSVRVDPICGGRLASLAVDGHELLVGEDENPLGWGAYPMVPFAGRIRHGRFRFRGRTHRVPATMGAHAIHGYGHLLPWTVIDDTTISLELGPPWPFAGTVEQHFTLGPGTFTVTMTLHAHEAMPVTLGWHPWFRRSLHPGGHPVIVEFDAGRQYLRDGDGLPDGTLVEPGPGPWDDCFTELGAPPRLCWPGGPTIEVRHDASHLVVYDQPAHAVCVEPQTGPPDAVTLCPETVEAGASRSVSMTLVAVNRPAGVDARPSHLMVDRPPT